MYEKYLVGTYRAVSVKIMGNKKGQINDSF